MEQQVFSKLRKLEISAATLREILEADSGNKVSRLILKDHILPPINDLLEKAGLTVLLSPSKYISTSDVGKGGFSNMVGVELPPDSPGGEFFVYIGRDPEKTLLGRNSDMGIDDKAFGKLLSIPQCCRDFFLDQSQRFSDLQNDYFLDYYNSGETVFCDPLTNISSQYFGYGLISYFPCSVNCTQTRTRSIANYNLIKSHDASLAAKFMEWQKFDYLYTEFDGIYALKDTELEGSFLHFDAAEIEGTSCGILWENLLRSDRIEIRGNRSYRLFSNSTRIMELESELVALCVCSA